MATCAAFVLIAAGAIVAALVLRPGEPAIDSQPARERFDVAYRALDDDLEGDFTPGCGGGDTDLLLQRFVAGVGVPALYAPLDQGSVESYVFFDANVDRPLVQCSAGRDPLERGQRDLIDVGVMVTTPVDDLEQFIKDLLAQDEEAPQRCLELDFLTLDPHADGEITVVTCRHAKDY
ncbi:MAG: hypothetical protein M3501_08635, partial [Actinomycetota bacterium]|nr:hypothetical protein [Actinomycetota bacterium]